MRKGFTLMELIIVVIIIGILAAIGVPQFFKVAERGRAAEAVTALGGWRGAQIRFASENGATTNVVGNLDYESTVSRFFGAVVLAKGVNPRSEPSTIIATMIRNNTNNAGYGAYQLRITTAGLITCVGGSAGGCAAAGY